MQMKKMNNKGFTLIELLAVLVILVVIMLIAIPSITSSVERSKAKQREQVINIVKAQAELYADKHKNSLKNDTTITIRDLVCEGYLTLEEAKDPMNENFTIDIRFTVGSNNSLVSEEHGGFKVALKDENGNDIDEVEYCRNYN